MHEDTVRAEGGSTVAVEGAPGDGDASELSSSIAKSLPPASISSDGTRLGALRLGILAVGAYIVDTTERRRMSSTATGQRFKSIMIVVAQCRS